jgi:hypothetical protein
MKRSPVTSDVLCAELCATETPGDAENSGKFKEMYGTQIGT